MIEKVFRWESEPGFAAFGMARPHDSSLALFDRDGIVPPGPFELKELVDRRILPGSRPLSDFPFGGGLRTVMVSDRARGLLGSTLVGDFHPCEIKGVAFRYWMFRAGIMGGTLMPGASLAPLQERYLFDVSAIPTGRPFCEMLDGYTSLFFDDAFYDLVVSLELQGLESRVVWTLADGPFAGRVVAGSYRLA